MIAFIKKTLLLASCMALPACATDMGLRDEFSKSMKAYNQMLRWNEAENAGMKFLEEEMQNDFIKKAARMRNRGVTMTDFRILSFECFPDKKSAESITEFDYFIMPSNKIKTTIYRQEWTYRDNIGSWKLKSDLPAFD